MFIKQTALVLLGLCVASGTLSAQSGRPDWIVRAGLAFADSGQQPASADPGIYVTAGLERRFGDPWFLGAAADWYGKIGPYAGDDSPIGGTRPPEGRSLTSLFPRLSILAGRSLVLPPLQLSGGAGAGVTYGDRDTGEFQPWIGFRIVAGLGRSWVGQGEYGWNRNVLRHEDAQSGAVLWRQVVWPGFWSVSVGYAF